jgi:hypothetical protein
LEKKEKELDLIKEKLKEAYSESDMQKLMSEYNLVELESRKLKDEEDKIRDELKNLKIKIEKTK